MQARDEAVAIRENVDMLVAPHRMGTRFKAMALSTLPGCPTAFKL
jgi:SAM-dependent MidA family methyltransferase